MKFKENRKSVDVILVQNQQFSVDNWKKQFQVIDQWQQRSYLKNSLIHYKLTKLTH